jgi:type II secretory pathway component PulK
MDRKALIREYKATRRPMGVFQVRNTRSGKVFLGSAVDLPSMLNRQRAQLQMGAHPNRSLQADWRALGADAFAFEVLDTLTPSDEGGYDPAADLRTLEAMWLAKIAPFGERGYNAEIKQAGAPSRTL